MITQSLSALLSIFLNQSINNQQSKVNLTIMFPKFVTFLLLLYYHGTMGQNTTDPIPIVMWHGMGDCCCNPLSMGSVQKYMEEKIPGVHVHSLMLGDNVVQDTENGFFLNINTQIEMACQKIQADEKLKDGFHAVGWSQGGLFIRGLAQRCPSPKIHNLVSIGGPQQGVYGLPKCLGENHILCDYMRRLLNYGAYTSWIQDMLVQAQYWHDPLAEEEFQAKSLFLADINNEGPRKNSSYAENLSSVDNLVLIKFTKDSIVDPRGSEWFSWFSEDDHQTMLPLQKTAMYKEDWLGLKKLDEKGRLHFISVEAGHCLLNTEELDNIIDNYLK